MQQRLSISSLGRGGGGHSQRYRTDGPCRTPGKRLGQGKHTMRKMGPNAKTANNDERCLAPLPQRCHHKANVGNDQNSAIRRSPSARPANESKTTWSSS